MTSFKISVDDLATRELQANNKTPVVSSPVIPVKASNPVQKSPENLSLQNTAQSERRNSEPNQSQRRQLDRRIKNNAMLLETRSQHDRRTKLGRSSDADKNINSIRLRGINEVI